MEDLNAITYKIRNAIYKVHNELGAGLFESVYEAALIIELKEMGLKVECQKPINATYKGIDLGLGFKMDLLVDDEIIIEIKSVEVLNKIHSKQLMTYLKLTKKKLGILINFNNESIIDKKSFIRLINPKV